MTASLACPKHFYYAILCRHYGPAPPLHADSPQSTTSRNKKCRNHNHSPRILLFCRQKRVNHRNGQSLSRRTIPHISVILYCSEVDDIGLGRRSPRTTHSQWVLGGDITDSNPFSGRRTAQIIINIYYIYGRTLPRSVDRSRPNPFCLAAPNPAAIKNSQSSCVRQNRIRPRV